MFCPIILSLKKCSVKKPVGQKKIWSEKLQVQKSLWPKKDLGFRSGKFQVEKIWDSLIQQKFWVKKIFLAKKSSSTIIWGWGKQFGLKILLGLNNIFGTPSETFQKPSRHCPLIFQTPSKNIPKTFLIYELSSHLSETFPTHSIHLADKF